MEAQNKKNIKAILFIDFDGVFHTFGHGEAEFKRVWRLENFLMKNPAIKVVFSTSWRYTHNIEQLSAFFNSSFRENFIGITPELDSKVVEIDGKTYFSDEGIRQEEIELWLKQNNHLNTPWMAIDDIEMLFNDSECLIVTKNGWDDKTDQELEDWLKSI